MKEIVRTRRFELPHLKTDTGPSSQRVYQFRHVRFYKSKGIKKVKDCLAFFMLQFI